MKRNFFYLATLGLVSLIFAACDPNSPNGPIPESFPKKQLIEEFTGQGCGYCPYGMDCIHEYIGNDTNWIVVLHHDGFSKDNFTVSGSSTITKALNVNGAPSIAVNRAKTKYKDEYGTTKNTIVFHPGYLETTNRSQFSETTYASIHIANQYDADTRQLTVNISGEIALSEIPELYLTILVKESGMIDTQADYYGTFEGWKEFRHTNAVRAFLSEAKGDALAVHKQRYSMSYTLTLDEKWVPENCMVVAFLSEYFKPVIQAEQRPVIDGTTGGADIQHGGITPVPVPDYYPEPNTTDGPSTYSSNEAETLPYSMAWSENTGNSKLWTIMAYDENGNVTISKTRCIPFTYLYVFTDKNATSLPYGTYPIDNTKNPGTVYAGFCNIQQQLLDGSVFYFTGKKYFDQGYLDVQAQWMIANGEFTITEEGWELIGHALNGADIHLIGSQPLTYYQESNVPAKIKRL